MHNLTKLRVEPSDPKYWRDWRPPRKAKATGNDFRPIRPGEQISLDLPLDRRAPLLVVLELEGKAPRGIHAALSWSADGQQLRVHRNKRFPYLLFVVLPVAKSIQTTTLSLRFPDNVGAKSKSRLQGKLRLRIAALTVLPARGKFSRYWATPWRRVVSRLLGRSLPWAPADFPYSHLDGLKYLISSPSARRDLLAGKAKTGAHQHYRKGWRDCPVPFLAMHNEPNAGTLRALLDWQFSELTEASRIGKNFVSSLATLQEERLAADSKTLLEEGQTSAANQLSSFTKELASANNKLKIGAFEEALRSYRSLLESRPSATDDLWLNILYARQRIRFARRVPTKRTYADWAACFNYMPKAALQQMREESRCWSERPRISVVVPVYNPKLDWLQEAIDSVKAQAYDNWELCLADDASPTSEVREFLTRQATLDERVKVVFRQSNGHIAAATNSGIDAATGEYIALLDQDDLLAPEALFYVARALRENPNAGLVYSDEDRLTENGEPIAAYFKSDFDPFLMRGHNMVCHLGVYRADLVRRLGGMREGFDGSQDWDLALRCSELLSPQEIIHIPRVLYHWRSHENSTARGNSEAKPYAFEAARKAIEEHLNRLGIKGRVELDSSLKMFRTTYRVPDNPPLVSIVICTRNACDILARCIESLRRLTSYPNYELIIVDNGSDDKATLHYLRDLQKQSDTQVVRDDGPFNFSRLNNFGVSHARGELVLLLNNDTEITEPQWLSDMVSIAAQRGVGAVGARLWYPDGRLQHGGVVVGLGGAAAHAHRQMMAGHNGYYCRATLTNCFSAVTAACLLVRKLLFEKVGGLDAERFAVAYNDVDFGLKLQANGYRNVLCATANLIHHESATRGKDVSSEKMRRLASEAGALCQRWPDAISQDRCYNPNLTTASENFGLAWPPLHTFSRVIRGDTPNAPRLAVCAIINSERPSNLTEWLRWHAALGFNHFYLYDHGNDPPLGRIVYDNCPELLHRVDVIPWHVPQGQYPQYRAYEDCLRLHCTDQWIAFIDADEFIFPKRDRSIARFLAEYEQCPGVVINWLFYGSNGLREETPEPQTTKFTKRAINLDPHVKSIVQPSRTVDHVSNPHCFSFLDGSAVNLHHEAVEGPFNLPQAGDIDVIRINHYYSRSMQEWQRKMARGRADVGRSATSRYSQDLFDSVEAHAVVTDDSAAEFYKLAAR